MGSDFHQHFQAFYDIHSYSLNNVKKAGMEQGANCLVGNQNSELVGNVNRPIMTVCLYYIHKMMWRKGNRRTWNCHVGDQNSKLVDW